MDAVCLTPLCAPPSGQTRGCRPFNQSCHSHKVKMKRCEGNLRGNSLPLCPGVDQCPATPAGQKRVIPPVQDGATCI